MVNLNTKTRKRKWKAGKNTPPKHEHRSSSSGEEEMYNTPSPISPIYDISLTPDSSPIYDISLTPDSSSSAKKRESAAKRISRSWQTYKNNSVLPRNDRQQEADRQREAELLQQEAHKIVIENAVVNQFKLKPVTNLSPNKAATRISRLYTRRIKHQLYSVCPNPDVCIAFGKETNKINLFFNRFTDFKYMDGDAIRIGVPSANGFVKLIQYSREGYSASAVLKSNQKEKSGDNLYYEYLVGKFINRLIPIFPCFLETYGLYRYTDNEAWKSCRDNRITSKTDCQKLERLKEPIDIGSTCTYRHLLAVLVQSVPRAVTLYSMLETRNMHFNEMELPSVLFQVYMPLSSLMNHFTHYDLHDSNVLLYDLKNEYIEYHYVMKDKKTVSFKSSYVAKIIDYGRCYLKDNRFDSFDVFLGVCKAKKCNPHCGWYHGYSRLNPDEVEDYIQSSMRNASHDLRLLNCIRHDVKNYDINYNLLSKLKYSTNYGTAENMNRGYPNSINNVMDACYFLRDMIMKRGYNTANKRIYHSKKQIGKLTVYADGRPMEYVSMT